MTPQGPVDDGKRPFEQGVPANPQGGTPVAEPTQPVKTIDTTALQANLDAIAAACRTPGLTWQQIAAIQAGLDFSTPQRATTAIRLANLPNSGFAAPTGMPRIPSAQELAVAAAAGQDFANMLVGILGPAMA